MLALCLTLGWVCGLVPQEGLSWRQVVMRKRQADEVFFTHDCKAESPSTPLITHAQGLSLGDVLSYCSS